MKWVMKQSSWTRMPTTLEAQHVYEKLGFKRVGVRVNAWKNQLGELQLSIDYELTRRNSTRERKGVIEPPKGLNDHYTSSSCLVGVQ